MSPRGQVQPESTEFRGKPLQRHARRERVSYADFECIINIYVGGVVYGTEGAIDSVASPELARGNTVGSQICQGPRTSSAYASRLWSPL